MTDTRSPVERFRSDAAGIAQVLRTAGIDVDPDAIRISEREDRLVAILTGDLMAWLATSEAGRYRLLREARVLDLLGERCSFAVPRILRRGADWQLRKAVPGTVDPWVAYDRVRQDANYARSVGESLGQMLAQQHQRIAAAELAGLVPEWPSWPPRLASLARDLPQVVDDPALVERALQVLEKYEFHESAVTDRVLTHGDLGLHNIAFGPDGSVAGLFDYDGAALTDRHHDFALMLFDTTDDAMLRGAVDAYEAAGGGTVDLSRVALLNAAAAIGFLGLRVGSLPSEKPAGRTLDEDLAWTRLALSRLD